MYKIVKLCILGILLICLGIVVFQSQHLDTLKSPGKSSEKSPNYAQGEVLVKFKPGTAKRFILALKQKLKVKEERFTKSISLYHWTGPFDTDTAVKLLQASPHVLYAEPNYQVHILPKPEKPAPE